MFNKRPQELLISGTQLKELLKVVKISDESVGINVNNNNLQFFTDAGQKQMIKISTSEVEMRSSFNRQVFVKTSDLKDLFKITDKVVTLQFYPNLLSVNQNSLFFTEPISKLYYRAYCSQKIERIEDLVTTIADTYVSFDLAFTRNNDTRILNCLTDKCLIDGLEFMRTSAEVKIELSSRDVLHFNSNKDSFSYDYYIKRKSTLLSPKPYFL